MNLPSEPKKEPQRRWLVVDYDGTCTQHDTTHLLPAIASTCAKDTDEQREARRASFKELEQEYFDLYNEARSEVLGISQKVPLHAEERLEGDDAVSKSSSLVGALEKLDAVSTKVTRRVSDSGVLAGLTKCPRELGQLFLETSNECSHHDDNNKNSPKHVNKYLHPPAPELQPGCVQTISDATDNGWYLAVLSINWCAPLIEATLLRQIQEATCMEDPLSCERRVSQRYIWSNAVDADGVVELTVPGAAAKRDRIASLQQQQPNYNQAPQPQLQLQQSTPDKTTTTSFPPLINNNKTALPDHPETQTTTKNFVVYIGDSSTDLLGLLQADVGVLIGHSSSAQTMAQHYRIPLHPLRTRGGSMEEKTEMDGRCIWVADSWEEIGVLLRDLTMEESHGYEFENEVDKFGIWLGKGVEDQEEGVEEEKKFSH